MCSESEDAREEIPSLPDVYRLGSSRVQEHLAPLIALGLRSILLFGVIDKSKKV